MATYGGDIWYDSYDVDQNQEAAVFQEQVERNRRVRARPPCGGRPSYAVRHSKSVPGVSEPAVERQRRYHLSPDLTSVAAKADSFESLYDGHKAWSSDFNLLF